LGQTSLTCLLSRNSADNSPPSQAFSGLHDTYKMPGPGPDATLPTPSGQAGNF
jgi:hypothetical protein